MVSSKRTSHKKKKKTKTTTKKKSAKQSVAASCKTLVKGKTPTTERETPGVKTIGGACTSRRILSRSVISGERTMQDIIHEAFNVRRALLLIAADKAKPGFVQSMYATDPERKMLNSRYDALKLESFLKTGLVDFNLMPMKTRMGCDSDHAIFFRPESRDNLDGEWLVSYEKTQEDVLLRFETREQMVDACSQLFDPMYWLQPLNGSGRNFTWIPEIENELLVVESLSRGVSGVHEHGEDDDDDDDDDAVGEVDPSLGIIGRFMRSAKKIDDRLHATISNFSGLSMYDSNTDNTPY